MKIIVVGTPVDAMGSPTMGRYIAPVLLPVE